MVVEILASTLVLPATLSVYLVIGFITALKSAGKQAIKVLATGEVAQVLVAS